MMKKIAIIGGGITGLAAALALEKEKTAVEYRLFEAGSDLGGKIVTEKVDGFLVEGGPDCYMAEKPWLTRLAEEIGLAGSLIGTNDQDKGTYIFSRGRLHSLPEGLMLLVPTRIIPFALSPLISWPGKLRMGLDFVLPQRLSTEDETLEHFVLRRLGREALEKIAEPLIGGIHGGDPATMSLQASFPRFLTMEKDYGSLVLAMLAARRKGAKKPPLKRGGPGTFFVSFRQGMGELVAGIRRQLNGQLLLNSPVLAIHRQAEKYLIRTADGDYGADGVILAVPAPAAARLLGPLDAQAGNLLGTIPMASSATVSLGYRWSDVAHLKRCFGLMVPHAEGRKINAVTLSSVKWSGRAPGDDTLLLRTFLGGAKNSPYAEVDEETIIAWSRQELADILGITAEPVMVKVHRWLKARPQYTLNHLDRIKALEERLAGLPGLQVAGGSYRGIGVPDCVRDGTRAAETLLSWLTSPTGAGAAPPDQPPATGR